jgi:O-antigen/teichoic acid export membrane protein
LKEPKELKDQCLMIFGKNCEILWSSCSRKRKRCNHESDDIKKMCYMYITKLKRYSGLLFWAQKGLLAILDQALFSGANFLVNILLTRWLPPEEYGAFAVALSIYYLLLGFHTAVITEPMMVFGAGKYREQFRKYFGMVLWGHWGISALVALVLSISAWVFLQLGSPFMAQALFGLVIATPFWLLLWLTRRACYAQLRTNDAVVGSGFNILAVVVGLFLLRRAGGISSLTGFVLLGATGGLASLVLLKKLRPQMAGYMGNPTPSILLADHWGYGRWSILGFLLYWASGQILMLLIPIFLGLMASAAVAATWTLYRPISQFMQALNSLVLPAFSRLASEPDGQTHLRRKAIGVAGLFAGAAFLYALTVSIFAKPILHFLYAGKYDEHWMLIVLFGIAFVFSVMTGIFVSALKAVGRVRESTKVWLISVLGTVILSVPSMLTLGVEGALMTFAGSYILAGLLAYRYMNKL